MSVLKAWICMPTSSWLQEQHYDQSHDPISRSSSSPSQSSSFRYSLNDISRSFSFPAFDVPTPSLALFPLIFSSIVMPSSTKLFTPGIVLDEWGWGCLLNVPNSLIPFAAPTFFSPSITFCCTSSSSTGLLNPSQVALKHPMFTNVIRVLGYFFLNAASSSTISFLTWLHGFPSMVCNRLYRLAPWWKMITISRRSGTLVLRRTEAAKLPGRKEMGWPLVLRRSTSFLGALADSHSWPFHEQNQLS